MIKTEKLAIEVIQSILKELPMLKGKRVDVDAIIKAIPQKDLVKLEVYRFIEEMKVIVVAIKFAYAAKDAGTAGLLIGRLIGLFESIGGINKKYSKKIEEIARDYKQEFRSLMGYKGKPEDRMERVLGIAKGIKEEIEADREKRFAVLKEKRNKNKGVVA